eukprot:759697-Hanusia_phi.AAC.4
MEEIKEQLRSSQRGSRDQNIRDRYHGVDTLTQKYLGKAEQLGLEPPEDKSITTIWVGLVPGNPVTERDVMDQFYAYGEVKSIQILPDANCAFVTYTTREAAEAAVGKLHGNLTINGLKLKIQWGKPQRARGPDGIGGVPQLPTAYPMAPVPQGAPMPYMAPYPQSNLPPPPPGKPPPPPPPGAGMPRPVYPSMDPSFHGTIVCHHLLLEGLRKRSEGSTAGRTWISLDLTLVPSPLSCSPRWNNMEGGACAPGSPCSVNYVVSERVLRVAAC